MSIVTTVTPRDVTWNKPKLFYQHELDIANGILLATSTASGYDINNIYNRLETSKWISGVTTTQYITHDSGYTAGTLTFIDSDDQGDVATKVWGDGTYIYLANGDGGLLSYSADGSGNLTHIDTDDQGSIYQGVWGDGTFLYASSGTLGLLSYSIDGSGNLTHIDTDNQTGAPYGVWGDGTYLYHANGAGGIHSYSVDGSGNFTHIDSDDQGDTALSVWGDGNFIYLANSGGGLLSYSVDGSGNLTFIDSDDQGDTATKVWGDGKYIYLANSAGGLLSYSVDDVGNLTFIDSIATSGAATDVWGDGNFIYVAAGTGGIESFSVDPNGTLTLIDSDDQGDIAWGIWGDGTYLYLANNTGGLLSYSDSSTIKTTTADYIILSGHNLGTAGVTATLQYSTDAFDADINDAYTGELITADTTYLKEYTRQSARYWRLKMENATVAPQISIGYWGDVVELEYCENDFDPDAFTDKAIVNVSQTGYVTGIYNKYKEREFSLSWNDADDELYQKIKLLVETIGRQNFVIAWETEEHSDSIYLVRVSGDFRNPYTRQAQYRNITLNVTGRVE
jgi:hypothetical protein